MTTLNSLKLDKHASSEQSMETPHLREL